MSTTTKQLNYNWKTPGSTGTLSLNEKPLGRGGEGSVYEVASVEGFSKDSKDLVVKIYHDPKDENRDKIEAMIRNQPRTESAAWPLASVYEARSGKFLGFIMKKLSTESYKEWAVLSNASSRKAEVPGFDFRYALTAAANLGIALNSIHKAGHLVGDINESNIFVSSSARVMLVDTDSAQVREPGSSTIYRCTVGKAEYTAPELSEGSLRDKVRTDKTDAFGYAVAVYQILTGGYLPTDGVFKGAGDPPNVRDKIRGGIYPTLNSPKGFIEPPGFPRECLPKELEKALIKSLETNPAKRGRTKDLLDAIKGALANLESCARVKGHFYDSRDGKKCPWCESKKATGIDPWGKNSAPKEDSQIDLPGLKFKNEKPSKNRPLKKGKKPGKGQVVQAKPGNGDYTEPPKPQMLKGKTVINYGGIEQARPALGIVFRSNKKLALYCINNETPWFMRFWWAKDQYSPNLIATFIGYALSLFIASLFLKIPGLLEKQFSIDLSTGALGLASHYLVLVSIATSVLLSTILLVSSLYWKTKQKKLNYKTINPVMNLARYLLGPIFWGPIGVIFVIIWLVMTALTFIVEELQKESSRGPIR